MAMGKGVMKRLLVRSGFVLLGLFVVAAALWGASRLRGPSAEQRHALELMQAEPELPGSNAFPALWLLEWDVPEQAQAAIAERDATRFRSLPPPGDPARAAAVSGFQSVAVESYPGLGDALAREPASCGWREGGCIEHVRANRDAHARRLAQAERLVDRVEAVLAAHGHYRTVLPLAVDMPSPRLELLPLAATRYALQFLDGETDLALANNCRALTGLRRLAGNSDTMLATMYLAAGIEGHAGLMADMLAELPPDHPLPAACAAAIAPLRDDELGLCQAMRGEWRHGQSAMDFLDGAPEDGWAAGFVRGLLLDRDATAALAATNLSWPCGEEASRALAMELPMRPPESTAGLLRFECVANLTGCILMDLAQPAYAPYGLRMQDVRARIRLLRILEWMRARASGGWTGAAEALLAQLPEELQAPGRAVDIDPATGRLRIELFDDLRQTHWSVPLPPALRPEGEGAAAP